MSSGDSLTPCSICGNPGHWEHSCPDMHIGCRKEIETLKTKLLEANRYLKMYEASDRFVSVQPEALAKVRKDEEKLAIARRLAEGAKEVLAVRGRDFERSPLPAYMERPFSVLQDLIKSFEEVM